MGRELSYMTSATASTSRARKDHHPRDQVLATPSGSGLARNDASRYREPQFVYIGPDRFGPSRALSELSKLSTFDAASFFVNSDR